MLPIFPILKKLSLDDREIIEKYTVQFLPYSDFNFLSMWIYNVFENCAFTFLNNNLVVKFQEYQGDAFFCSFLGHNHIVDTIERLFEYTKQSGLPQVLKLLPEDNFASISPEELVGKFYIKLDVDNYDYILSTEALMNMNGQKLYPKKKAVNRFIERYISNYSFQDITDPRTQKILIEVFDGWTTRQLLLPHTNKEVANEKAAFLRTLNYSKKFHTELFCVFVENTMVGFTIFEQVSPEYALSSFQKGFREFTGIYEFMYKYIATHLYNKGVKYINIEQDLGINGMRIAKSAYTPEYFRKYIIKPFI